MTPQIIDIRPPSTSSSALPSPHTIISALSAPTGKKSLPTVLLYDTKGLRLYDDITTKAAEWYYLFGCEEGILKEKSTEIVETMLGESGAAHRDVVELGAGSLRKTSHLLSALSSLSNEREKEITYYALDLSPSELSRTLSSLPVNNIEVKGICGTYEDGIEFITSGGLSSSTAGPMEENAKAPDTPEHSIDRSPSPSPSPLMATPTRTLTKLQTPPPTPPLSDEKETSGSPLHILFLGSSLGNFDRDGATAFLKSLPLRPGSGDTLLLGLDNRNSSSLINLAYDDPLGVTKNFIMNGLDVATSILSGSDGEKKKKVIGLESEKWDYESGYDESSGKHDAWYKSKEAHTIIIDEVKIPIEKGELIHIESSYKYADPHDTTSLFNQAQLRVINKWEDKDHLYGLYLLERGSLWWPLDSAVGSNASDSASTNAKPTATSPSFPPAESDKEQAEFKSKGLPTLPEWTQMWKSWDLITTRMISPEMMFVKPIDLRHICLFYLGHISAFLDIHLSRILNESHSEPVYFKDIFERGIDPHVDDPTQCHPHSEVPTNPSDWPTLSSILSFRDRVRQRLISLYDPSGFRLRPEILQKVAHGRKLERVLWMTFEHEGWHAETLLYMLLQKAGDVGGTLPPPGFIKPPFSLLSAKWDSSHRTYSPATLGPTTVTLGHNDLESSDPTSIPESLGGEIYEYGWDNEAPQREAKVGKFKIERTCVTNGEYLEFLKSEEMKGKKVLRPASWVEVDGAVCVRTLYGPLAFEQAQHWPLLASYDELSAYAIVKGGRLPTDSELRLFMDKYESGYEGANLAWRNWHPVPAVVGEDGEKGHNGGVWEWTSTVLYKTDGFVPSVLYPGYSTDFHDGKHHVVLGGSYCTIPRIAQRRTVVNYYQHNYRYAFVGARVVYDVEE